MAVDYMKLRQWVGDICERRELKPCWYNEDGDCGNWPTCLPTCPLRQLREFVGFVPQDDGGIDRQPKAEKALKENAGGT